MRNSFSWQNTGFYRINTNRMCVSPNLTIAWFTKGKRKESVDEKRSVYLDFQDMPVLLFLSKLQAPSFPKQFVESIWWLNSQYLISARNLIFWFGWLDQNLVHKCEKKFCIKILLAYIELFENFSVSF
jgi:hypothetical protein